MGTFMLDNILTESLQDEENIFGKIKVSMKVSK